MSEIKRTDRRPGSRVLHPDLYGVTALAVLWILVVVGFAFFGFAASLLPEGVIIAFSLMAFGVPALLWRIYRYRHNEPAGRPFRDWIRQRLDIFTGSIGAKQAALQVLLIPGAAVLAFTVLALIDMVERGVH